MMRQVHRRGVTFQEPVPPSRTHMRLASAPRGTFGRWERTDGFAPWRGKTFLSMYLPPECVAPGGLKMRSPRQGLRIVDLLDAVNRVEYPWQIDEQHMKWLFDQDVDHVLAIANMNRLRRMVTR